MINARSQVCLHILWPIHNSMNRTSVRNRRTCSRVVDGDQRVLSFSLRYGRDVCPSILFVVYGQVMHTIADPACKLQLTRCSQGTNAGSDILTQRWCVCANCSVIDHTLSQRRASALMPPRLLQQRKLILSTSTSASIQQKGRPSQSLIGIV